MLHDAYERHALTNGWETQAASRKHWEDVPEANRNTMLAMVEEVLPSILEEAFDAGYDSCSTAIYPYYDGSRAPDFKEWYRVNYAE
jgi:hypothetical protein